MLKKFGIGAAVVALAIVGIVFTTHAAKNENKTVSKQTFNSYYRYLGSSTDLEDFQERSNWVVSSGPGQEPNCGGNGLPCLVESSIPDIDDFVESIDSESDVLQHVLDEKNP